MQAQTPEAHAKLENFGNENKNTLNEQQENFNAHESQDTYQFHD